jgi:hypothetical protein
VDSPVFRAFLDFQRVLEPTETPLVSALPKGRNPWAVPDFCAKTKKQEVQPFMDYYQEITEVLQDIRPDTDEEDYEGWGHWEPSPSYIRLSKLANRIGQLAYQEVDNPVYNEDECLAWKEGNMVNFTKIEWGMSDFANTGTHPLPSEEVDVSQSP